MTPNLIPTPWPQIPLGRLFERQNRPPTPQSGVVTAFRDGKVMLRSRRRTEGFTEAIQEIGYQEIRKNDLVIHAMDGFAGAIGVSEDDGKSSPVYTALTPRKDASPHFYGYVLRNYATLGLIQSLSQGIRERSTDFRWAAAKSVLVPAPPVDVQRNIVDYLDHEIAEIDAFIGDQQEVRVLLQERWESLLVNHIQTGMKDPRNLEETGIQEWPRAPRSWRKARLKTTMTDIKNGSWGDELDAGEVNRRCIRVADFEKNSAVIHDRNATKRSYPASTVKNLALRPGDLLIEKSGGGPTTPVGNVVSYNGLEQAMYSNFVARMRLNTSMDSRYTTYLHRSLYLNQVTHRSIKQTTGIQNLDASAYFNETVFLPPRNEQVELGAQVEESRLETESALDTTAQAIELSRERRAALITAAVTGQIDVTAKNKPAAEQLEDDIAQGLHKES